MVALSRGSVGKNKRGFMLFCLFISQQNKNALINDYIIIKYKFSITGIYDQSPLLIKRNKTCTLHDVYTIDIVHFTMHVG